MRLRDALWLLPPLVLLALGAGFTPPSTPGMSVRVNAAAASSSGGGGDINDGGYTGGNVEIAGTLTVDKKIIATVAGSATSVQVPRNGLLDLGGGVDGIYMYGDSTNLNIHAPVSTNGKITSGDTIVSAAGLQVASGSPICLDGATCAHQLVDFAGFVRVPGNLLVVNATVGAGGVETNSGGRISSSNGICPLPQTLQTCAAGIEGTFEQDGLSGASTGHATRVCVCRSDGAGAYAWRNILNPILGTGTATTCGD